MGILKSITSFFKGKRNKKETLKEKEKKILTEVKPIKPALKKKKSLESKKKTELKPMLKEKKSLVPKKKTELKAILKKKKSLEPKKNPETESDFRQKQSSQLKKKSDFISKQESFDTKKKLEKGLEKTRKSFFAKLGNAILGKNKVDNDVLDNLEEVLITSDVGVKTTIKIIEALETRVSKDKYLGTDQLMKMLREEIITLLLKQSDTNNFYPNNHDFKNPYVIMVVGVNGVGKTTTIGKLAHKFKKEQKQVILGASDTFRAAAIDQLKIWAERVNVPIVSQDLGSDPASVAFDTLQSAKSSNKDIVIIDTAGRLHNKVNLMNELSKIKRVMDKVIPNAPHEVLLVLDGSTGQNAFEQAKQFTAATDVNALAITKLDGTSKGGVVLGVSDEFKIPVKYIGIGESIDDLQVFNKEEFIDSFFNN